MAERRRTARTNPSRTAPRPPAPFQDAPRARHRFRIRLIVLIFFAIYAAIAARLVYFQVDPDMRFSREDLRHIDNAQIERLRGDIVDRSGRVLATNRKVPSLSVNPSRVTDAAALSTWLAPRLRMDRRDVHERLTRTNKRGEAMKFVYLKRRMTDEEFALLGDLDAAPDSAALLVHQEAVRFYPDKELAAHVIGFANREGQGGAGIEQAYDNYLSGKAGLRVSRQDRYGRAMAFKTLEFEAPTGGDEVRLTLDAALQYSLEQELDAAMERNNARQAMGILMNPDTGAILALATRPSFDPNRYTDYDEDRWRNAAVIETFEPGSSFKIVTAAAALELGLVRPTDAIDCMGGRFNPYGHTIRDTHPLNVVSFTECFAASSNIAMIKVAALLGPERLESWIRAFGFGQLSGLGLPGESAGLFRPRKRWSRLSMGSLPMGQEISVNMVQLARAFSVIANGGRMVAPHIVSEIHSREGLLRWKHDATPGTRIIAESTAQTLRELCYAVVNNEEGTGSLAAIREYRVGGKTGTAQVANRERGGYYSDRYTAVFAGFAPVSDPKIVCVIVVNEPMIRLHYGGYVCGPVFSRVVRETLVRLHVPPDPMPTPAPGPDALSENLPLRLARATIETADEGDRLDALELLEVAEDQGVGEGGLPRFAGMTKREAKALTVSLGVAWDPRGVGRVVRQDPPPGTPLDDVRICTLVFSTGVFDEHSTD